MAEPRPNPNNTGASFNLRTPSTPTLPTSRAFTPSPRTPGNPLSVYGTEFAATPSGSAAPGTPLTAFSDSVVPGQNHDTLHHITENRSNAPPSTSAHHPLLSSAWLNLVESGTDDRNLNRSAGRRRDQPRMQLEEILKSKADVLSLIHYAEDLMSSLLDRIAETVTQARNAVIPIDRNQLENQRRRHASFGLDEYLKMLPQLFKRLRIIELVLKELLGFQAAKPSVEVCSNDGSENITVCSYGIIIPLQ